MATQRAPKGPFAWWPTKLRIGQDLRERYPVLRELPPHLVTLAGKLDAGECTPSVISPRAYVKTSSRMERMAAYTFRLLDGCGEVEDETGVNFGHPDHAIRYARNVVHELMRNRELETRSWRLDVYENG